MKRNTLDRFFEMTVQALEAKKYVPFAERDHYAPIPFGGFLPNAPKRCIPENGHPTSAYCRSTSAESTR